MTNWTLLATGLRFFVRLCFAGLTRGVDAPHRAERPAKVTRPLQEWGDRDFQTQLIVTYSSVWMNFDWARVGATPSNAAPGPGVNNVLCFPLKWAIKKKTHKNKVINCPHTVTKRHQEPVLSLTWHLIICLQSGSWQAPPPEPSLWLCGVSSQQPQRRASHTGGDKSSARPRFPPPCWSC